MTPTDDLSIKLGEPPAMWNIARHIGVEAYLVQANKLDLKRPELIQRPRQERD